MATPRQVRLPNHWPEHIKSGVLHAISLAGVLLSYARSRATGHRRLRAQLEEAKTEIALLQEELGQPASIGIVERFIRSMKQECTRCLLVPLSLVAMRREVRMYASWYNEHRPHMALEGKTPCEVFEKRKVRRRRFEPRPNRSHRRGRRHATAEGVRLSVSYIEGRRHLPIIELHRAA